MISYYLQIGSEWTVARLTVSNLVLLAVSSFFVISLSIILAFFYRSTKQIKIKKPNRKFDKNGPDVIIIGSGVAGSALATVLARDGRKVTVIERDMKEPDRIVGELLQPGGLQALTTLGLKGCVEGLDAQKITGYVIHNEKTKVLVPYPEQEEGNSPVRVTNGTAFHHGRFIMALREKAKQEPNVTYIEGTVTKLLEENSVVVGVEYKVKDSDDSLSLYAPLTFVVDGCFSKFRKELVKEQVTVTSHFVGLLLHHFPQTIKNHAELVISCPSPVLIYQISSTCTRVLVDIRGVVPKKMKDHLLDSVCPMLPEHMHQHFKDSVLNGRVRTMPNSFLPPSPIERPGVLVLGDAYNMRHPLTGGGMSVCLSDVVIWREFLQSIPDLSDYETVIKTLRVFHLKRKSNHSFVVNVLANALYELFAGQSKQLKFMKKACLEYFQLGGQCVEGPVSLLSVINPKPHILIGHFFAVALYAAYKVLRSGPLWALPRSIYHTITVILSACNIIFPLMWSETKSLLFP